MARTESPHTVTNTIQEELDKRGLTFTYLWKAIRASKHKVVKKMSDRTLKCILTNKLRNVTVAELIVIGEILELKESTDLKWWHMIKY